MEGLKDFGEGFLTLINVDEEALRNMYTMVAAACDMFNTAHPSLPEEMYKNPTEYVKELNDKAKDFCEQLLNQTQLFYDYYELAHRIGGVITYQSVHVEMLRNELNELKEKLSRYENND